MSSSTTSRPRATQVPVQGGPTPPRSVPFATTVITPMARERALGVLGRGWVTTGAETVAFERELADHLGAADAVAVSSCTAGLELALRALRLPAGAAVLTPTITFCGAVHAIVHAGLRPVLVDVDAATLVPRPDQVAAAAARHRPAAMVVQHMAGYPAPVRELAAAAGLSLDRVVEDAAHGLGTFVDDQAVGTISALTAFSFYATKNLPIGEGGAVTTADPDLASFLRRGRLHGMTQDAWRRYLPGGGWQYSVETAGLKANMSDLQAAIGRGQLASFAGWQHRREELASAYDRLLGDVPGVALPARPASGRHAWHLYVAQIGPEAARGRDIVAQQLADWGIGTSVHFIPIHHFPYFRGLLGDDECAGCPEADAAFERLLSLPLHPAMTDDDVAYVCERLTACVAGDHTPEGAVA